MSFLNNTILSRGLFLAGSLSFYGEVARADAMPPATSANPASSAIPVASATPKEPTVAEHLMRKHMEGRAGLATMCINLRSRLETNEDPEKITAVTPRIYIDKYPEEGINTLYVEGNEIAKKWDEFLKPKDKVVKDWLDDTDIPAQAEKAFRILKRLDKDKDGIVTKDEFEAGTKGQDKLDTREEMWFLKGLACDSLYFRDGPTHQVRTDDLPKVVVLKQDLGKTRESLEAAKSSFGNLKKNHDAALTDLEAARLEINNYRMATAGLGALGILLGIGMIAVLARKKGAKTPAPPAPGTPAPDAAPRVPGLGVRTEVVISDNRTKDKASPPPLPKAEGETRAVTDTASAVSPPQPATRTVVGVEGDMADLAAALASASKEKTPLPGISPSTPPTATSITADNVIIRETDAKPSAELNKNVVMAEIAYLNPKFLTDDGAAIHTNFRSGVEQLADLAMHAFGKRDTDAASPTELWRVEHGKHGSMIRGGLPEQWLREFVSGQLEKWHAAGAPGMSFDVTTRETMERDAARRAGERSAYEKWVENALRGL